MITFVNAKINIGLRIIHRLPTGYHQLETIFYPVGLHNGTPYCPEPFCDVLEVVTDNGFSLAVSKWNEDLPMEKNIVWKAFELFSARCKQKGINIEGFKVYLQKFLPSQAGLGGGSADAALALKTYNELSGYPLSKIELMEVAGRLGADCPFFLINQPSLGQGIGDSLSPVKEKLKGLWCALVKPEENISTGEAFASLTPSGIENTLLEIYNSDIRDWRGKIFNDFEKTFFFRYPHCRAIKEKFYEDGALYCSLSGSGSAFYAIFSSREAAHRALQHQSTPYRAIALL